MRIPKKPAIIGGVVVAAMFVGAMLSDLFQGFGPGGADRGTQIAPPGQRAADVEEPVKHEDRAPGQAGDETVGGRPPLQPGEVLNIVIDGRAYAVRQMVGDEERLYPMELSEIAELAKAAPGNNEGIRVQVFRRESSRPTAERALENALHDAGLESSEILQAEELLK